jgi:hypothetical protein
MAIKLKPEDKREIAKLTTKYEQRGLTNTAASRAEADVKRQIQKDLDQKAREERKRAERKERAQETIAARKEAAKKR